MKLTPFLRQTQNEVENFYINYTSGITSGLNAGNQTSKGFEFELNKGDFARNGFSGQLSFAYTYCDRQIWAAAERNHHSRPGFNAGIAQYNAYTKAGGGAPCYTTAQARPSATCAAGSIANPVLQRADPAADGRQRQATPRTTPFPGGVGCGGYSSLSAPYVSTLLLQWKHGPLAITPALQFEGGIRYGVPLSTPGIDPSACTGALAGSDVGRSALSVRRRRRRAVRLRRKCGSNFAIPNPFTGRFDNVGAFVSPNQLLLHTQVTYDVNKRVTLVGNFANIINRCWGGTKVPFAINHACNYVATYGADARARSRSATSTIPATIIQPFLATPYDPTFPNFPFNVFVEARIKI